ncbi:hypothetical protein GCM10010123_25180 [Pilimelia anulata]|uniref:HTH marR-type domain-containing protein n=1 Tax=Pilimelia anulata TaxID=53371 RepID=A0A8J3FAZ0_9ACTN|nr:MarR family winged helix-turn-helix transcriptional regulator [Pilimelia anulata]GGJ94306.1 hypothetical protein GCM10010123_25180 [Pilimelia anulata]
MDATRADALNEVIRTIALRHRALAGYLLAPLGLHAGQEVVILALADGPCTQGKLAAASGCEPPTISGTVRKLAAAGLVERCPSPTDGRATLVALTPAGAEVLARIRCAWGKLAELTAAGLTEDEVGALLAGLRRIADNLVNSCGEGERCRPDRPAAS